ncbi:MAG: hypothetical protein Q8P56_01835 [Candidatus Uhrbacteria bacterium]|nr:hypothetical protein [Candidatus Uhrbacteria bacterium]
MGDSESDKKWSPETDPEYIARRKKEEEVSLRHAALYRKEKEITDKLHEYRRQLESAALAERKPILRDIKDTAFDLNDNILALMPNPRYDFLDRDAIDAALDKLEKLTESMRVLKASKEEEDRKIEEERAILKSSEAYQEAKRHAYGSE